MTCVSLSHVLLVCHKHSGQSQAEAHQRACGCAARVELVQDPLDDIIRAPGPGSHAVTPRQCCAAAPSASWLQWGMPSSSGPTWGASGLGWLQFILLCTVAVNVRGKHGCTHLTVICFGTPSVRVFSRVSSQINRASWPAVVCRCSHPEHDRHWAPGRTVRVRGIERGIFR